MSIKTSTGATGKWLIRTPAVAAVAVMALLAMAAPALADGPKVYAELGAGSAWFKDYGDHVYLCDHSSTDHHSVAVHLEYTNEDGDNLDYWRWNWWGGGTCKDLNLAVDDDTGIYYKVCLGDFGTPGGKPADVIPGTCSNTAWDEG